MQLGFDRQHFTLPRVGISLRLNKSLPATPKKLYVSLTCGAFLFDFVVKGLVTDQFHLVRIVERLPEPGSHGAIHRPSTPAMLKYCTASDTQCGGL
ncbi:hypothetical protein VRB78_20440 [Pseudomonas trivialis]